MLSLRVFVLSGVVKVWLCDENGEPLRELQRPIGHPGGSIDWERTAGSCTVLAGEEGIELTLVTEDGDAADP